MKALILAAGLGTRLMPLTATLPKALVSIRGVTLLEMTIRRLAREGFTDLIVNVHHHAGQVVGFLEKHPFQNVNIAISDESGQLLDTGGAIFKARWFLDGKEPFLVHNVDVISTISLKDMLAGHRERAGLATLAVIDRMTRRYLIFDDALKLRGWTDTSTGEVRWAGKPLENKRLLAFSGIHFIEPEIFNLVENEGAFSIIDTYLSLAGTKSIYGFHQSGGSWIDLGKPAQLELASQFLEDHPEYLNEL